MSTPPTDGNYVLTLGDGDLSIEDVARIGRGELTIRLSDNASIRKRVEASVSVIDSILSKGGILYGINTGFGGMAPMRVSTDGMVDLQMNLLRFLKAGCGKQIPQRDVRSAMAIRARSLLWGASGIRWKIIERIATFLNEGVTPQVHEYGSIGASGDLVPLAHIAGALIGLEEGFTVEHQGQTCDALDVLKKLGLERITLNPKEGLALVNGTSMSTAIAANCLYESRLLLDTTLATHALIMQALGVRKEYFKEFIHQCKPHLGQLGVATRMRNLLRGSKFVSRERSGDQSPGDASADVVLMRLLRMLKGESTRDRSDKVELLLESILADVRAMDSQEIDPEAVYDTLKQLVEEAKNASGWDDYFENEPIQDRYSLRCLPQYLGPIFEGMQNIESQITVELNSATDNPLVDSANDQVYHGGNFLAEYTAIGMDQFRQYIGMLAIHLDVQIACLVEPSFSQGLPPSLIGNLQARNNSGLKGLQIAGNSIVPLLSFLGNPIADRFPTHAEQFNQNVSSLAFASANLARQSLDAYRNYLAIALIFGVQAVELRAGVIKSHKSYDATAALSPESRNLYLTVRSLLNQPPQSDKPLIWDDAGQHLDHFIATLADDLERGDAGQIRAALPPSS